MSNESNEPKQTAVEWLMNEFSHDVLGRRIMYFGVDKHDMTDLFSKALEMEREQMREEYDRGYNNGVENEYLSRY